MYEKTIDILAFSSSFQPLGDDKATLERWDTINQRRLKWYCVRKNDPNPRPFMDSTITKRRPSHDKSAFPLFKMFTGHEIFIKCENPANLTLLKMHENI